MTPLRNVSALTLGAVQLGMPYGVANQSGQPDEKEARAILAAAYEGGISCIDTAAAYGHSEAVIGRSLVDLGLRERMTIVTKVPALTGDAPDAREARRQIAQSITRSLERLGVERLGICLFHREDDIRFSAALLEDERVAVAGCSVMTRDGLRATIAHGLRAVQIPVSLVDTRCTRTGDATLAAVQGVAVFARSVYLQGLLLMPEDRIPAHLAGIVPARRALEQVAAAAQLSLGELALRYVLGLPGVRSVVVGAESVEQVRRNAAHAARGPLPAAVARAAEAAVPPLPDALITPHCWPQMAEADAAPGGGRR